MVEPLSDLSTSVEVILPFCHSSALFFLTERFLHVFFAPMLFD